MASRGGARPNTGGARPGAGRKTIAAELGTADLAKKALIARYGSLENSLQSLLDSGEPALIKFVHEHAFGKPTEKVEHSGGQQPIQAVINIIKPNDNI